MNMGDSLVKARPRHDILNTKTVDRSHCIAKFRQLGGPRESKSHSKSVLRRTLRNRQA